LKKFQIFVVLRKPTLYGEILKILYRRFIATPIDVLYANVVKFGRRKIGKIVRCLPAKIKQNFAWLSSSLYYADRMKNLLGPAPENVPRMLEISSKSVDFRWSNFRTREHRQSAIESESNIRLQPSFEPNNRI